MRPDQTNFFDAKKKETMAVDVFVLRRLGMGTNAFGVARTEEWQLNLVDHFANEAEAKDYVRKQHRRNSEFILLAHTLGVEQRETFLEEFSFGSQYITKRQFYIGTKPQIRESIVAALRDESVRVVA
jgi:hypothetical protein